MGEGKRFDVLSYQAESGITHNYVFLFWSLSCYVVPHLFGKGVPIRSGLEGTRLRSLALKHLVCFTGLQHRW